MGAKTVNDNSFQEQVIEASNGKPVLVDFWATWCSPCKMLSPVVEQIASEQAETLQVVKINVDENPSLQLQYNVMSVPTLMLFKDGEPVKQVLGYMGKERLLNKLGL